MAENQNKATMAEKLADDVFPWLKWKKRPLMNVDWECVYTDKHGWKTHPSDCVFWYQHPYEQRIKYINVDLKSYAKDSITKDALDSAIKSLSKSVVCANVSEDFREKHVVHDDFNVDGLLFIYNHDGGYDKRFSLVLKSVKVNDIPLLSGRKLHVFGPELVARINDIINDMGHLVLSGVIPSREDYTFFYPDLVRKRRHGDDWGLPAIPEWIASPWLFIKHKTKGENKFGYVVYYNKSGETYQEFLYFLDYLSRIQVLLDDSPINVRFTQPSQKCSVNFEKAQSYYCDDWEFDSYRRERINSIKAKSITNFSKMFSELEIGMGDE